MADLINDGDASSAALFMQLLETMRSQGQSVLDSLESARNETLFRFQQGLNALNAKRQRAARVLSPDVACRFLVTDFLDVNQQLTTATVRCDAGSATLKERAESSKATVRSLSFSCLSGTTERFNGVYQVHVLDGSRPTGVFDIELAEAQVISLLSVDMAAMPGGPALSIATSPDGITMTPATRIALNGYRVDAWFQPQRVKYIRISITPEMPDTLGGSTYSFGITDLTAYSVEYYLYSEVVSKPIRFYPCTSQVRFKADNPDLAYFLQFNDGAVSKISPDEILTLPQTAQVSVDLHTNPQFRLCTGQIPDQVEYLLPDEVYPSSLRILDVDQSCAVRIAYGLDPADAANTVVSQLAAVKMGWISMLPVNLLAISDEAARTYRVSYATGPSYVDAVLRVQLTGASKASTPIFSGAYLENIY